MFLHTLFKLWIHTKRPIGPVIGMLGQFAVLPAISFCLCVVFKLKSYEALGILIISCCPGGSLSNFFTFCVDGDLPLRWVALIWPIAVPSDCPLTGTLLLCATIRFMRKAVNHVRVTGHFDNSMCVTILVPVAALWWPCGRLCLPSEGCPSTFGCMAVTGKETTRS